MNPKSNTSNQVYGKILGLFPGLRIFTIKYITRKGRMYPLGTTGVILEILSVVWDERLIKIQLDEDKRIIYVWEKDIGII